MGDVGHRIPDHLRHARGHDRDHVPDPRPSHRHAYLQSRGGRRCDPVAAPVLVLRASRGLHHLSARHRHGVGDYHDVLAAQDVRLPRAGAFADCRGIPVVRPMGSPHVHHGIATARRKLLHGIQHAYRDPQWHSDLLLDCHSVGWPADLQNTPACSCSVFSSSSWPADCRG